MYIKTMALRMKKENDLFKVDSADSGKMKASELKSEAESSKGTSKPRRLKRKRTSRTRSHGQLGMGSESHLVKCGRTKKKRLCGEQGGTDASKGDSDGQVFQLYEGAKPNMPKLPNASSAVQQPSKGSFKLTDLKRSGYMSPSGAAIREIMRREKAELALKFYKKNQDDKFEIAEVLESNGTFVQHPNYDIHRLWIHICFTATSKNDGSTKYFFGEIYRDEPSGEYCAAYCDTFEPRDDSGFEHGCVFCPSGLKYHPADGYLVGRPPWYVPYVRFG